MRGEVILSKVLWKHPANYVLLTLGLAYIFRWKTIENFMLWQTNTNYRYHKNPMKPNLTTAILRDPQPRPHTCPRTRNTAQDNPMGVHRLKPVYEPHTKPRDAPRQEKPRTTGKTCPKPPRCPPDNKGSRDHRLRGTLDMWRGLECGEASNIAYMAKKNMHSILQKI